MFPSFKTWAKQNKHIKYTLAHYANCTCEIKYLSKIKLFTVQAQLAIRVFANIGDIQYIILLVSLC